VSRRLKSLLEIRKTSPSQRELQDTNWFTKAVFDPKVLANNSPSAKIRVMPSLIVVLLSVLYLFSFNLTWLGSESRKASMIDRPLMYSNGTVWAIINIGTTGFLILIITLLILDWKILIALTLVQMLLGRLIFAPLVGHLLAFISLHTKG